jgi:hypothetical protein
MSATCPECDSPIDVDEFDVDIGDELTCSEGGSLLRVSSESPVELESADDDEFEDDEKDDDGDSEEESDELDDLDDDNDEDDRDDVDDE